MDYRKLKEIKAKESRNKKRLLDVNPKLDEKSGIYFLTRTDENGENQFYIGQALHIISRLAQHLSGYQYIDISLKAHGFYSEENPYGYKVNFLHFPQDELDEKEKYYIKQYLDKGWISKNKTAGGQGKGKVQIAEYKPSKGYRDGLLQGKITLARELSHIIDKHLVISLKPGKENNKTSQKQLEKFYELIRTEEDDGEDRP